MILELQTRNFRNLKDLSWRPSPGVQLLLGGTGAGKTSVLEAAYVVATTRSFRAVQLEDCLASLPTSGEPAREARCDASEVREAPRGERGGAPEKRGGAPEKLAATDASSSFRVAAEVDGARRVHLEVGWSEREGSYRAVNGKGGSLTEHLEPLAVLAWTAAEGEVLLGAPELGRRLLDRGVLARRPQALSTLGRYRRVLQQKRRLLLERHAGLEVWNEVLARSASEVVALRRAWVEDLSVALRRALEHAALPYPRIDLVYEASPSEIEQGWERGLEALARVAARERQEGRVLLGPHRDRLRIRWGGRDVRRVASAGERKALGLLLLAAQGEVLRAAGRSPLYLLDDADAELDRASLEALWPTLERASQALVTSNRPEVWEGLSAAARWRLRQGALEAA